MGRQATIGNLFRAELKSERMRRAMSQARLAEMIGERFGLTIHASTVAKIESGERDVRIDELHAFAELFGMSTDALLGRIGTGTDVMWAASKLTTNAQKMVAELIGLRERLTGDMTDLVDLADREQKRASMRDLIVSAGIAVSALLDAQRKLAAMGSEFPLPGMSFDR